MRNLAGDPRAHARPIFVTVSDDAIRKPPRRKAAMDGRIADDSHDRTADDGHDRMASGQP
jgi:hypothetical protein